MKISAGCWSQMSDPPGFVDASREKLPHTFDIFNVCNSGVCKRRQKPVGDGSQEASNMKHELFTQKRSERMGWKIWYHFTEIVKLQISWRDVSLSLYNCRFREFWMEDWLLIVRNRFSGKDAKSIGLMILCNGVFKGSFLRSGYRVSKWAIGHEYLLRSFQTKSDLNGN